MREDSDMTQGGTEGRERPTELHQGIARRGSPRATAPAAACYPGEEWCVVVLTAPVKTAKWFVCMEGDKHLFRRGARGGG